MTTVMVLVNTDNFMVLVDAPLHPSVEKGYIEDFLLSRGQNKQIKYDTLCYIILEISYVNISVDI